MMLCMQVYKIISCSKQKSLNYKVMPIQADDGFEILFNFSYKKKNFTHEKSKFHYRKYYHKVLITKVTKNFTQVNRD